MRVRQRWDYSRVLPGVYRRLFKHFGPQYWWPGDTPFEVAVGAILTQNTAWSNASQAISELRREGLLRADRLEKVTLRRLARLIRSSGYFNQKAIRLKTFVAFLIARYRGSMARFAQTSLMSARQELLALKGIGPETADSILLYALHQPVFVIDAYTRRILARHSLIPWNASYEETQALFMEHLRRSVHHWNEYHALIVVLGKEYCHRTRPKCDLCPLRKIGRWQLEVVSPGLNS